MIDPDPIRERFSELSPHLNERERRLLAATEANAAGYGGIAAVARATGLAASTIGRGLKDLAGDTALTPGRVVALLVVVIAAAVLIPLAERFRSLPALRLGAR